MSVPYEVPDWVPQPLHDALETARHRGGVGGQPAANLVARFVCDAVEARRENVGCSDDDALAVAGSALAEIAGWVDAIAYNAGVLRQTHRGSYDTLAGRYELAMRRALLLQEEEEDDEDANVDAARYDACHEVLREALEKGFG